MISFLWWFVEKNSLQQTISFEYITLQNCQDYDTDQIFTELHQLHIIISTIYKSFIS